MKRGITDDNSGCLRFVTGDIDHSARDTDHLNAVDPHGRGRSWICMRHRPARRQSARTASAGRQMHSIRPHSPYRQAVDGSGRHPGEGSGSTARRCNSQLRVLDLGWRFVDPPRTEDSGCEPDDGSITDRATQIVRGVSGGQQFTPSGGTGQPVNVHVSIVNAVDGQSCSLALACG
ncbi:hypothetical protein [Jongsikchunia kroppenstedtii]|uniref:hypothetical protein n=1 Tax=Jongsikchunia kroppenstedtii TaxID=1121721 RepID=UPI001C9DD99C|nr:hypothetical protein [Jongsikchunia kroppenstedtii]